jgi:hypothetical protein
MKRRNSIPLSLVLCALFAGAGVLADEAPPAQAPSEAKAPVPAPPPGPAPHIVFDNVLVTLGDVVHGQDAVATFSYHNTGDAPLHILSAKPG